MVRRHQHDAGRAGLHAVPRQIHREIRPCERNVNERWDTARRSADQNARQFPALAVGQVYGFADVHRVRDEADSAFDQEIDLFGEGIEIDGAVGLKWGDRGANDAGVA